MQAALMELGAPGGLMDAKDPLHEGPIRLITNPELSPNNRDNPSMTAGLTFLGQFLDHDMTFDRRRGLASRHHRKARRIAVRLLSISIRSMAAVSP